MAFNVRERVCYLDADKKTIQPIGWFKVCTDSGVFLEPVPMSTLKADGSTAFPTIHRFAPRSGFACNSADGNSMYATNGKLLLS